LKPLYTLRPMRPDDISQVVEIDKLSFSLPWSYRSYMFEVTDNQSSHMMIIEYNDDNALENRGFLATLRRLGGYRSPSKIVGYGGFWFIDGETHISTIATHPDYRGKGLGEILLAGMLARAAALNAEYAILEVRVSNTPAITLYKKYGFTAVGKRKGYYRDNNEDADLMHLSPMNADYLIRLDELITALKARVPFIDFFSQPTATRPNK
jgi:[ribosomal protein S18]-alanine N-acetyltransferase